jgi:hypothetical protein
MHSYCSPADKRDYSQPLLMKAISAFKAAPRHVHRQRHQRCGRPGSGDNRYACRHPSHRCSCSVADMVLMRLRHRPYLLLNGGSRVAIRRERIQHGLGLCVQCFRCAASGRSNLKTRGADSTAVRGSEKPSECAACNCSCGVDEGVVDVGRIGGGGRRRLDV